MIARYAFILYRGMFCFRRDYLKNILNLSSRGRSSLYNKYRCILPVFGIYSKSSRRRRAEKSRFCGTSNFRFSSLRLAQKFAVCIKISCTGRRPYASPTSSLGPSRLAPLRRIGRRVLALNVHTRVRRARSYVCEDRLF